MGLFGAGGNNTQNSRLWGYRVSTSISAKAIPLIFGTNRVGGNVIWTGDWTAHEHKHGGFFHVITLGASPETKTYTYTSAGLIAIGMGQIQGILHIWQSEGSKGGQTVDIISTLQGGKKHDGLVIGYGTTDQAPWSYLTSHHPDQALGYSGIAYVAAPSWDLGSAGVFPNYSYEVQGLNVYAPDGTDAECSDVLVTLLSDPLLGAGFSPSELDVTETRAYCLANDILVSPILDAQKSAADWIKELLLVANAEAVYSGSTLKLRSRGDSTATGNGVTFTPNITPVADLDDTDFMDRDEPVRIMRPDPRDAYNSVTINWTNRGNQYNTEPLTEQDQASIDQYGYRPASAVDALGICRADVAAKTAHIQLKRNLYNRTQYQFRLGFEHILLEPMDIVTLTCKRGGTQYYQRLNLTPVRLLSIAEDADGYLDCTAEEMPIGAGTPVAHPKQTVGGFLDERMRNPGNVNVPIFYEATYEMRQSLYSAQYALLIGLSGGARWGGCTVYRSWDGTTYDRIGQQAESAAMGSLSAALPVGADPDTTDTLSVNLLESFGELSSVSQADADNLKTLCVLGGGPTSELVAYETATLTGTNTYDLTYLRRGVYQSPIASHAIGDAFLFVDNVFIWVYQAQDIGKTVYFKFTSFNQYANSEQSLADVTAYPYTLTGGLSAVKSVTSNYTVQPGDVAVNANGTLTVTLPSATSTPNTTVVLTNTGTGTVTISGGGSGVSTTSLTQANQSITLESTPSGWIQIASNITANFADDETPSGTLNGTNGTFTLAHAPNPAASLELYLNGVLQIPGVNYTLSGTTITFLTHVPASTSTLRAWYRY